MSAICGIVGESAAGGRGAAGRVAHARCCSRRAGPTARRCTKSRGRSGRSCSARGGSRSRARRVQPVIGRGARPGTVAVCDGVDLQPRTGARLRAAARAARCAATTTPSCSRTSTSWRVPPASGARTRSSASRSGTPPAACWCSGAIRWACARSTTGRRRPGCLFASGDQGAARRPGRAGRGRRHRGLALPDVPHGARVRARCSRGSASWRPARPPPSTRPETATSSRSGTCSGSRCRRSTTKRSTSTA